uniref:Uncharacterized protein n=1 Tax=Manihot esculenta TaxID=3983 RepID=A0A2C9U099_MANES
MNNQRKKIFIFGPNLNYSAYFNFTFCRFGCPCFCITGSNRLDGNCSNTKHAHITTEILGCLV